MFPGKGSIYLHQEMKFLRPMFVDVEYEAIITVKDVDTQKNKGVLKTQIIDKKTGKITIDGIAELINPNKFC
jgi:acyl dehydratase